VATVLVKILDPADSLDFLTLAEAKMMLGLPATPDPIADPQLAMQITIASATISQLCHRAFGYERVAEMWSRPNDGKIWLTRWPVLDDDIETVTGMAGGYELENESGMLLGQFSDPVRITYSGGFELPDDAPPPLKQACMLMLSQARSQATRESIEGIRMIAHKDSRVLFFDPSAQAKVSGPASGTLGSGIRQVDDLLFHFCRFWV
jgi:hypothetical protein